MPGLFDRIKDTTQYSGLLSVGTSFVVDNTPSPVYQSFRSRYAINDANIPVAVVGQATNNWMVCWCTYTALDTLRVDQIIFTSNTVTPDAAVTFSGTSDVFVTASSRAVAALREVNTFTANNYFTTGNVGIGTASPAKQLHVVSAVNFEPQIIADHVAGAGTGSAYFILDRARGTPSAKTAVVSGDSLGTLMARGYDGSAQQNSAWLSFDVDGTVSAGNVPAGITFFTTPVGGSTAARMHVDADGNVGIGTTGPSSKLTVSDGTVRIDLSPFSGSTGYVGTQSNHPLGIITNNVEAIRVTTDSRVGINTGTPGSYDAKLAVFNGNFALTTTTNRLYLYYASATNHAYLSAATGGEIIFANGTASPVEKMRLDTNGNLGVGATTPKTRLHAQAATTLNSPVLGSATNAPFYVTNNDPAYGLLVGTSSATGDVWLQAQRTDGTATAYNINLNPVGGRVGIGTASPNGNLTVFSSAANDSSHIRVETNVRPSLSLINSGVQAWSFWVDSSDSNKLKIGSANGGISTGTPYITATTGGNVGVGVTEPTFRFVAGNSATDGGWIYSASAVSYLGLGGYSTAGSGAFQISYDRSTGTITFNGGSRDTPVPRVTILNTGVVGINQTSPGARLHITDADAANALLVAGPTRGLRVFSSTTGATMEGVDQTGVGSYQPLLIGGSEVRFTTSNNERMRIHASGGISFGSTTDPGTGITAANATFRINRFNTTSEGGELQFCRASDNSVGWLIDLLGAGTGTDPTTMRFIDNLGFDGGGAKVRAEFSSRGVLSIVNDLGPTSTDTLSVGFRGSPNNDRSSAYTLALTDAGRTIRKTSGTAFTVTIPASDTFPLGTCIMLCNVVDNLTTTGGVLSVTGASGGSSIVFYNGSAKTVKAPGTLANIAYGGSATLRKVNTNLWVITGAGVS